ncbi:MAG: HYR domain-containing protein [Bacteroidetes bacterium]|nr:HYR domain-containing protein [Bacteroidota bacterium]
MSGGFASGAAFPSGVTTVTYTVADQSGNSATCSFTVTVSGNVSSTQNLTICNGASVTVGTNTYSTAGVYTDLLANAFGCDSVVTTVLSVTNVNTGTTLNGIVLSAAANGATYQWLDCDNGNAAISGATSQTFTPSVNGNYAVVVTENGCTDTSACTSVTVVGLQEAFGSEFSLHPNPSNGLVTIEFGQSLSDLEIRVTDLTGKVLYAKDHVNGNQVLLDMRSLSHGVYLVEVRSADLRKALRMVVQ